MDMKAFKLALGLVALALLLSAVPLNVSADSHTIAPGQTYAVEFHATSGEMIPYLWNADAVLHFTIREPGGATIVDATTTYDSKILTASSGTYRFSWTNTGTTPVTLYYTIYASGVTEHGVSMLVWGAIIAVIVIAVVVVLAVVLLVMGGKKQAAPPYGAQVAPPMALVGGNCPMCGSPVDPQGMFCPKCGARLR